jgi:hypothetical protein
MRGRDKLSVREPPASLVNQGLQDLPHLLVLVTIPLHCPSRIARVLAKVLPAKDGPKHFGTDVCFLRHLSCGDSDCAHCVSLLSALKKRSCTGCLIFLLARSTDDYGLIAATSRGLTNAANGSRIDHKGPRFFNRESCWTVSSLARKLNGHCHGPLFACVLSQLA